MLCYTISDIDYQNCMNKTNIRQPKYVYIGSVKDKKHAENIANNFTCQTYIRIINNCIFIVCK